VDLVGSAAYQRAGYAGTGNTAEVNAHKLLRTAKVAAAIAAAQAARAGRTHVTQDQVLLELSLVAHSSIADYAVDDLGRLTAALGVSPDVLRAISSLKTTVKHSADGVTYVTEVKLWSKPTALNMEARHLGMFVPVDAVTDLGVGLAALLAQAQEAARVTSPDP
jgi:phage terminase small subunit